MCSLVHIFVCFTRHFPLHSTCIPLLSNPRQTSNHRRTTNLANTQPWVKTQVRLAVSDSQPGRGSGGWGVHFSCVRNAFPRGDPRAIPYVYTARFPYVCFLPRSRILSCLSLRVPVLPRAFIVRSRLHAFPSILHYFPALFFLFNRLFQFSLSFVAPFPYAFPRMFFSTLPISSSVHSRH